MLLFKSLLKMLKMVIKILLINGLPVGAVNRIPVDNEIRANLHIGGLAKKT